MNNVTYSFGRSNFVNVCLGHSPFFYLLRFVTSHIEQTEINKSDSEYLTTEILIPYTHQREYYYGIESAIITWCPNTSS